MKRLPPSLFNLGSAVFAGPGIAAGYAGVITGSMILLVIALLCALVCALLQAIAFQRAVGNRLEAMLADFRPAAPASDDLRRR